MTPPVGDPFLDAARRQAAPDQDPFLAAARRQAQATVDSTAAADTAGIPSERLALGLVPRLPTGVRYTPPTPDFSRLPPDIRAEHERRLALAGEPSVSPLEAAIRSYARRAGGSFVKSAVETAPYTLAGAPGVLAGAVQMVGGEPSAAEANDPRTFNRAGGSPATFAAMGHPEMAPQPSEGGRGSIGLVDMIRGVATGNPEAVGGALGMIAGGEAGAKAFDVAGRGVARVRRAFVPKPRPVAPVREPVAAAPAAPTPAATPTEVVPREAPAPAPAAAPPREAAAAPAPETAPTVEDLQRQLEQERAERRSAEREAETDAKTGAGNRRAFDKAAPKGAPPPGHHVVMFDLNHLHATNEYGGHALGDAHIADAVGAIRGALSDAGAPPRVFRLGGDEFAAIVPEDKAPAVAARAQDIFGERPIGRYTARLMGRAGPTAEAADAALMAAKAARPASDISRGLPPPAAPEEIPGLPKGIVEIPTKSIEREPETMQFKDLGPSGVGATIRSAKRYNPDLAKVIDVWRDPETGRTLVVNGHNRHWLAERDNYPTMWARFVPAKTAAEARAFGAIMNIAEGHGTPVDVAKFLRDAGMTMEDLEARGVPVNADLARHGAAIARLAPDLFQQVATGKIPQKWGSAIGEQIADQGMQREALAAARQARGRLSSSEVREIARQVAAAGSENVEQATLFGNETERKGLYVPRARLAAALKDRIASDRRLFGFVTKEGRAEDLSRAGETKIDVGAANDIAVQSARGEELFNRLYTRSGPIAEVVNEGAKRVARGERATAVARDIYPQVADAITRELAAGTGGALGPDRGVHPEAGGAGGEVPGAQAGGAGEEAAPPFVDPKQAGLFGGAPESAPAARVSEPGSPGQSDLFGREPEPEQESLFGAKEGTAAARSLSQTEAAARGEIPKLREQLRLETVPEKRAAAARRLVELEKLVNRDKAISPEELSHEAAAREAPQKPSREGERGSLPFAPDPLESQVDLKSLPEHSRRIQEHISVGERPAGEKGSVPSLGQIYTRLVRRTAPIERAAQAMGGKNIPTVKDAGAAALFASGSPARAESFLTDGPYRMLPDGNTELTGVPSYKAILAPLEGRLNDLRRYELAVHTLDLAAKDKPVNTGIEVADAQAEVNGAAADVKRAHELSVQYRNALLEYWRDAGGISPQLFDALKRMYENYVPLQRVIEGDYPGGAVGRVGRVAQQVRRLFGGKRTIIDPIESTVDATRRIIAAADRQRVGLLLVELAEANPEAAKGLVERAPREPPKTLAARGAALKAAAAQRGVDLTMETAAELADKLSDRPTQATVNDMIRVWRNGKNETWYVAPEIGHAMRAMSPAQAALWVRLLSLPARGLKAGVTLNPAFATFNLIRDSFDATLQSRYGFKLGIDSFRGFAEAVRKGKYYKEFRQGGGDYSGFYGGRRSVVQDAMRRVLPESPGRKALGTVLHPIAALRELGRPFEEAARLGEFMRARKAGADVLTATRAGMEVTTNFRQIGSEMNALAQMTAFLNPAIQSLDTAIRVAGRDPGKLFALGVAAISLPSLILWAANRNDQEITDLRKTRAGLIYWFVRLPNGTIARVPKPFLWGQVFGTGMESALDQAFAQDPDAVGRWADGIANQAGSNVIPTALQTYFALQANKEPFFGTPIVPRSAENVAPAYQVRPYTGEVARRVGKALGVSPAKFEFLVRQLTGTLGGDVLRSADALVSRLSGGEAPAPATRASDNPVLGRFFAHSPALGVEPIQTFYRGSDKSAQAVSTLAFLRRKDPKEAIDWARSHQVDIALAAGYDAVAGQLKTMSATLEAIRRVPGMDAETKRRQSDDVIRRMVELARRANLVFARLRSGAAAGSR